MFDRPFRKVERVRKGGEKMTTLEGKVTVNNTPPYAEGKYIVAKAVYGEVWFEGAWSDEAKAEEKAKELENGFIVRP